MTVPRVRHGEPGHPLWFGPDNRRLLGIVQLPGERTALGGVLIVPPLGYEHVVAHRTLRSVAERLAARGFVVLRYDHAGTGDSSGSLREPDLVASWVDGVGHGLEELRRLGAGPLTVVGMRAGALFGALAGVQSPDVDALVLWDPVVSGAGLVRQWQLLHGFVPSDPSAAPGSTPGGEQPPDGSLDVLGMRYLPETVADLSALDLPADGARSTLVLTRSDRPDRAIRRAFSSWSDVEWSEAVGQSQLLDGESSTARVPNSAIDGILTWLAERAGGRPRVSVSESPPPSVGHVTGPDGRLVFERAVTFGPHHLFAMVTSAEPALAGPMVIFLNNAADYHIGPARMWVDWGRTLAADGWTAVRMDIPAVGDSPSPPGYDDDFSYPVGAVADIAQALNAEGLGRGAVLVGLCSGGRHALEVAPLVGAGMVIALNTALHMPRFAVQQIRPSNPYPQAVARLDRQPIKWRVNALVPAPLGRWRAKRSHEHTPLEMVAALRRLGTDVVLGFGADEFNLKVARSMCRWLLADLERQDPPGLHVVGGLDHALMSSSARETLMAGLTATLGLRRGTLLVESASETLRQRVPG